MIALTKQPAYSTSSSSVKVIFAPTRSAEIASSVISSIIDSSDEESSIGLSIDSRIILSSKPWFVDNDIRFCE